MLFIYIRLDIRNQYQVTYCTTIKSKAILHKGHLHFIRLKKKEKKNEKQTEKPYQTKYNFMLSEYITSKEREYFFLEYSKFCAS